MRADTAVREWHIEVAADSDSAVVLLASASGLSRGQIKLAMHKGAVWLGQGKRVRRLRRAKAVPAAGSVLHCYYDPKVLASSAPPARLLADEGAYSVWYKPYGMLSQGSKWGDHTTLYRWAEGHLEPQRSAFPVHRLDRAASGLALLAHSRKAAAQLSALFAERRIDKRYRALVHGRFPDTPQPLLIDQPIDGRAARSRVQRLAYRERDDRSLLEVAIETGRKHQIRRHLAGLGHAIVGDRLHGRAGDREDLQLTACRLAFQCPLSDQPRCYQLPQELMPGGDG